MRNYYYSIGPFTWDTSDNSWRGPVGVKSVLDLRNLSNAASPVQGGYGFFATTTDPGSGYVVLGQGDLRTMDATNVMKDAFLSLLGYQPEGVKLVDLIFDCITMGADPTGVSGPKPLTPCNGCLTLDLSNHSPVKSSQFRLGHSKESNRVISTYQNDYLTIRDATLAGRLPTNHHRKVLDFWGAKFGVKNPHEIFIPNGIPVETPLPHSTSQSENFDGADNAAVGKQLTWIEDGDGSHWDNFNNAARKITFATAAADRSCYANSAFSGSDLLATGTLSVAGNTWHSQSGITCRRSNSAIDYYMARILRNNDTVTPGYVDMSILKVVAGVATLIGSTSTPTISLPDDISIQAIGSTIKSFFNGSQEDSLTDTSLTTGLYCGLYGYVPNIDSIEFTGWAAEDVVAAADTGAAALMLGLI